MTDFYSLPEEDLGSPDRRTVAVNIIGAILVLALINWLAYAFLQTYTTNRGYWLMQQKWHILQTAGPADTIILGDSSANQGVATAAFDEPALNLATFGPSSLYAAPWILEEFIEYNGPPQRVVLVFAYSSWHGGPNHLTVGRLPLDNSISQAIATDLNLTPLQIFELQYARYLPLYYESTTLSEMLQSAVFDPTARAGFFQQEFVLAEGGTMQQHESYPDLIQTTYEQNMQFLDRTAFRINGRNEQALDRIMDLARQYGFEVYLANGPIWEGLAQEPAYQAAFFLVDSFLQEKAAATEGLYYLEFPRLYPQERMGDSVDHVRYDAAVDYTHKLIRAIQRVQVNP